MEITASLLLIALYKALEKFWDQCFDAAWEPVDTALKERFKRWAARDKASERRAAFTKAATVAKTMTIRQSSDPEQAESILSILDNKLTKKAAQTLAEEATKLLLFSATPDLPRMTRVCQRAVGFEALVAGETPPSPAAVAAVLSAFLTNLREALLDQEAYHSLIEREMLRTLRRIAAELRPVGYDDEDSYRFQVAEMNRQLEFVGIPELKERRPITLEEVYIQLRVEGEPTWLESRPATAVSMLKPEAEMKSGVHVESSAYLTSAAEVAPSIVAYIPLERVGRLGKERLEVQEALREQNRLVILGDPGTGKTTMLQYATVMCAEGRSEEQLGLAVEGSRSLLPIFIHVREFAAECAEREQDYCLLDHLYTYARERLLLNMPPGFFEDALEAGRCLVCLDGLDEVWAVGQRRKVCDAVRALVSLFPQNRYVVTSRIVGYEEAPLDRREFAHYIILPLEESDIQLFVRRWYKVRERDPVRRQRRAEDLLSIIEREPRVKTLASNPLLLTIIALVHRIEAELPNERVKLYDKCVTALVETWEEVKGLTINARQRPFFRYRRRLLEQLAYELHIRAEGPGQLHMLKEGDLELLLIQILMGNRRLGLQDDPDGAREEARAFIGLVRGRTGLLVERGDRVFGFPHLTFQEYLAACDIESRCMPYGIVAIWDEIKDHLHDPHWREIILLLLGSLNRYEDAPTALVEWILEAGDVDRFEPVLHRNLYLAARALADRIEVATDLRNQIVGSLVEIACTAPWWEKPDAVYMISALEDKEYAVAQLTALAADNQLECEVRGAAAEALGEVGREDGRAVDLLLALASDNRIDRAVRSAAAEGLGQVGCTDRRALDLLLALASDDRIDPQVRGSAISALRQVERTDDQAMNLLLALASDDQLDPELRSAAVGALGWLGRADDRAVDLLLALAGDDQLDPKVRWLATELLTVMRHDDRTVNLLRTVAGDHQVESGLRSVSLQLLAFLGCRDDSTLGLLFALADDDRVDPGVRDAAATALGRLGRADDRNVNLLLALAGDDRVDPGVRGGAAATLGQLGRADDRAVDLLLALAGDDRLHPKVRVGAGEGLVRLERADDNTLDLLLALAGDNQIDPEVRAQAVFALGWLERVGDRGLELLFALAGDDQIDPEVRAQAAHVLGWMERIGDRGLDLLLALAGDDQLDLEVRRNAVYALGDVARRGDIP